MALTTGPTSKMRRTILKTMCITKADHTEPLVPDNLISPIGIVGGKD